MPRFAANLSFMFQEIPFPERFPAAAKAGFKAVEFLFPYDYPAAEVAGWLKNNGLVNNLFNLPPGDFAGGERGIASLPGREEEFRAGVPKGLASAKALGVPQLNCMAGIAPKGVAADVVRQTFVDNLRFAAGEFKKAGVKLVTEPINTYDIPGFYLNTTAQAISILDEVGSDNLYVQYDIYHAQRMEGELAATIEKYLPRIAHMQLADNPKRNEPGSGEINYAFLFAHVDRIGYDGWIGCEYKPATSTEAGLGWRQALAK